MRSGKNYSQYQRREKFLEQNPHVQQLPSMVSIVGGHGDRIKNDSGWKDNMSRIAEAHLEGSPLASRLW